MNKPPPSTKESEASAPVPCYPADVDHDPVVKTTIARMQGMDLRKIYIGIGGVMIRCGRCHDMTAITMLYKCRWCAVWYCHRCGETHFGPDNHNQDNDTSAAAPEPNSTNTTK